MHRKANSLFPARWHDPSIWPSPATDSIPSSRRPAYEKRKRAITRYMNGDSLKDIHADEGIDASSLYGQLEACAAKDADGNIMGFRALVPYFRKKAHERSQDINRDALAAGRGASGLFLQLLESHASLNDFLLVQAKKYAKRESSTRIPVRKEHELFLTELAKLKGKSGYPFVLQNLGREGYRQALHKAVLALRGEGRGPLRNSIERAFRPQFDTPYRRIQIDAHRLDQFIKVRFVGRKGRVKTRELRPWLIAAVDVDSKACLGWYLSLEKEPSRLDLLRCLYNVMSPWKRRDRFEIDTLRYKPGAGMPSGMFERCAGRFVDCVSLDNALCGHADDVREIVLKRLHAVLQFGIPGEPRTRSEIEQLFNTLTHRNIQHQVGGVRPDMGKGERESAMKAVEDHGLSVEQMEEYLDVVICNYNAHPNSAHYAKSPLDVLRDEPNDTLIRADNSLCASWRDLLIIEKSVPVKSGDGHAPHINYLKATYSNDLLRAADQLIGKSIVIKINLMDLRTVEAQVPNGPSLGKLFARGQWSEFMHDDRLRRRLNREIEDGNFHWVEDCDPEQCVSDFLNKTRRSKAAQPDPAVVGKRVASTTAAPSGPPRTIADVAKPFAFDLEAVLGNKLKG